MISVGWRFPPLSGGTRQGYTNNDIEVFKGQELIDNLAREICQNSLDARSDGTDAPVKVVFELQYINKDDYDVFLQYSKCLEGCRKYWGNEMDAKLSRFVSGAEQTLQQAKIPILVASDYNTKGLGGSHSRELSSAWEALTGSDGVSVKNNENSAGSYGIGKNAPFACSSLSMVFYNTLAENNESAFIGVARLATLLNAENKPTQRVGKYQNNDEDREVWNPIYATDSNHFRDCFLRKEQGTDVIIVGFTQTTDWMKNVTKAVLKNFFVAISERKLIVEIKDNSEHYVVDTDTLPKLISSFENDNEMTATAQLFKAFTIPDCKKLYTIFTPDDVEVYIKSDSTYKRTIANFRASGMLVGTYYKRILQHYAAVVIIRGEKLGELLKDTEPPRHNRWDYKQIEALNQEKRSYAKKAIEDIENYVFSLLKSQFETVVEDTVDAAGVGEYLPDTLGSTGDRADGDDLLKAKIKIDKVKINRTAQSVTSHGAIQDIGSEDNGEMDKHSLNPTSGHSDDCPPRPVSPNNGKDVGTTVGNGVKIIYTNDLIAQRAFPISFTQGLYKLIIKPAETYEKLYVECFVVGEDGHTDALEIESVTYNGQNIKITGNKAGPIKMAANLPAIFFVKFLRKEKMKLSVHLTEVCKK